MSTPAFTAGRQAPCAEGEQADIPANASLLSLYRQPHTCVAPRGVEMFERFTDRARRVVVLAQEEAKMLNHNYIGTEHILLGLIHEGEGVAAKALDKLGVYLNKVREQVNHIISQAPQHATAPVPITPEARKGI